MPAHTLSVEAPATAIPNHIEVDVSALEMGATITADDLSLPDGVELAGHSGEPVTVASITPPTTEAPASDDEDAGEGEGDAEAEAE